jgi:hypothetical protein
VVQSAREAGAERRDDRVRIAWRGIVKLTDFGRYDSDDGSPVVMQLSELMWLGIKKMV